jgi:hypothetical protein
MTKTLRIAMAAVTAGAAVLSAAAPAAARDHHRWHHDHNDDGDVAAAAVVAGVLGLAIGAAIMSSAKRTPVVHTVQRGDYVSLPAEDAQPYAAVETDEAAPAPAACSRGDWAWDGWEKRYVWVVTATPC